MWFTHLHYALATLPAAGLDQARFVWGALAPDADKVWPVPRAVTHVHDIPRPIRAADLLPALGVDPTEAPRAAAFLAGYASHIAVDSAWYRQLRRLKSDRPDLCLDWTNDTTRAWNLALDLENRVRLAPSAPDLRSADGDAVVPWLAGPAGAIVRGAVLTYLRWGGRFDGPPPPSAFAPVLDRFRNAVRSEGERVVRLLAVLDREALDTEVIEASRTAARDVFAHLGGGDLAHSPQNQPTGRKLARS